MSTREERSNVPVDPELARVVAEQRAAGFPTHLPDCPGLEPEAPDSACTCPGASSAESGPVLGEDARRPAEDRVAWSNGPGRGIGWDAFREAMWEQRRGLAQCYAAAYDALGPVVAALLSNARDEGRERALCLAQDGTSFRGQPYRCALRRDHPPGHHLEVWGAS